MNQPNYKLYASLVNKRIMYVSQTAPLREKTKEVFSGTQEQCTAKMLDLLFPEAKGKK